MDEYIVYVKVDDSGIIKAIDSDAFISDASSWIEVGRGTGDRYFHAQSGYLAEGLVDDDGIFNYKLENGVLTLRSDIDKAPEREKLKAIKEISVLKEKLAATDYISAKLAEGAATREEYADKLSERAAWRTRINELENMI